MKKERFIKFWLFLCLFTGFMIWSLNFSVELLSGKPTSFQIKRGYIFDRNFEPIVITIETYKAFFLRKDKWFTEDIPSELRTYISSTLNLPKKGLIPLGENLTLDEIEKLQDKKNIFIEKKFVRKLLVPELSFLIGEVFNDYGVSGIEKMFDGTLKKGEPVVLSLDLKLEKKLLALKDFFNKNNIMFSGAIISLYTGEVKAYVDEKEGLFQTYLSPKVFGIILDQTFPINVILGKPTLYDKNINLWYVAEVFLKEFCGNYVDLTFLKNEKIKCSKDIKNEKIDFKKTYFTEDGLVQINIKNAHMVIARFRFEEKNFQEKGLTLEKIEGLIASLL